MNTSPRFPTRAAFLGAIAGALLGLILWAAEERGCFQTWRLLGAPLSGAARILYASGDNICVLANDTSTYCFMGSLPSSPTWQRGTPPAPSSPQPWVANYHRPQPPGRVVQSAEAGYPWAEVALSTQYVLLDDGKVWQWRHATGSMFPGFLFTMPVGCIGGFVVTPLLVALSIRLRKRRAA